MRVLCTCLPGHGHFNPMVSLAHALVAAGHQVAFATAATFCPTVEAAGFEAFPAGISLADQLEQARRHYPDEDRLVGRERFENFVPKMLAGVAAPPRADDLVPIVGRWRPDLLVHDETEFAGPIAATVAGIPYADQSVGIMRPLSMAGLSARTLAPTWRRWGVDLGPYGGLFGYLYLDVCPPSLQSWGIRLVDVAYPVQNAVIDPPAGERLPAWVADLPPVPTAYVSLGTVFNRNLAVFGAILDGLGALDLNVIVTIGSDNDPAALGPQPSNIHVERYISQELLLPFCNLAVNQGGTAILPILAHGLPILVLPQGANQFHNADACVAAGLGRRLLPAEVSAESIRAEVRSLLEGPYAERARGIAAEIEAMPGPEEGVRLLERLERERRRLPREGVTPPPVS
ncbi:MAG: glycosyltransferase [Acidimicrobiales bacterium]